MGSAFLTIVEGPDIDAVGEQVAFGAQSLAALGLPGPSDFGTHGSRRQVLIDVGDGAVMFTVAATGGTDAVVQMGPAALTRLLLEVPPTASAHVTTDVLSTGELVETTVLRAGARVAVVAPHGGFVEQATDVQALRVLSDERLLTNVWVCRGPAGDAFRRWHVTSDDLSEQSFPGLETLLRTRHDNAVSFHGFDAHDGLDVIVGGRVDRPVKERVQQRLESALSSLMERPAAVLLATSMRDPFPGLRVDNVAIDSPRGAACRSSRRPWSGPPSGSRARCRHRGRRPDRTALPVRVLTAHRAVAMIFVPKGVCGVEHRGIERNGVSPYSKAPTEISGCPHLSTESW